MFKEFSSVRQIHRTPAIILFFCGLALSAPCFLPCKPQLFTFSPATHWLSPLTVFAVILRTISSRTKPLSVRRTESWPSTAKATMTHSSSSRASRGVPNEVHRNRRKEHHSFSFGKLCLRARFLFALSE